MVSAEGCSGGEGSAKPLKASSECAPEPQAVLTADNGSHCMSKPASSSGNDTLCEADTSLAIVPFIQDPSARSSFDTELNMNNDNEEVGCDWQSLIACSSDLFIFDSPDVIAPSKGSLQKSQEEETNVFDSLLSRFPSNQAYDMQHLVPVNSIKYDEIHEIVQHSTQPTVETEMQQIDQVSENHDFSTNEFLSGESGPEPGKEVRKSNLVSILRVIFF